MSGREFDLRFRLNGTEVSRRVPAGLGLLDLLRDLGCHSVKFSDEHGAGGADTVLVDDRTPGVLSRLQGLKLLAPEVVNGKNRLRLQGMTRTEDIYTLWIDEGTMLIRRIERVRADGDKRNVKRFGVDAQVDEALQEDALRFHPEGLLRPE